MEEHATPTPEAPMKDAKAKPEPKPKHVAPKPAHADLTWQGPEGPIAYEATVEHIAICADDGTPMAKVFCRSYVAKGEGADGWFEPTRPVTFCYNGGPGCASVPLDFGGIGPVRARPNGTRHLTTPASLQHNPACLLPLTDLVFIDAPSTGWSFAEPDYKAKRLYGVDGDGDAFCRTIQNWLTLHKRWNAPVFLFGESYGTVRDAVLARLLGEAGVGLRGVVQLSTIYDWASTLTGSDSYYLGMTPTYAAVAQWLGKVGAGMEPNHWFEKACAFVNERLCPAFVMGDRLDGAKEAELAQAMSEFVGLSPSYLAEQHLRVELEDFRRELLKDEGKVLGRLDLRFVGDALPSSQGSTEFIAGEDAADDALEAVWTGAFRALMDHMGYENTAPYLSTNWKVNEGWNWTHQVPGALGPDPAPNVAFDMAMAMRRNPTMRVCYLGGRYDAATPYWNLIRDLSAQFLPKELKERQEFHLYGAGHMIYVDEEAMAAMTADLKDFYRRALAD